MRKSEQAVVVRLVRHMQQLQRQISKPTAEWAKDEEVKAILGLLWEWTPNANQRLPSKHVIEQLVGLMRGCDERVTGYIGREKVAQILRKACEEHAPDPLMVMLNKGWEKMTDVELYKNGRWNYKETSLVKLLFDVHANPSLFDNYGNRKY